jgi:Flp pilus assembly CpaE family ATPase
MSERTTNRRKRGLGTVIVGPTQEYTDYLYRQFTTRRDLEVFKILNEYPTLHNLVRLINSYEPEVVFLEIGKSETAIKTARDIQAASQGTAVIGFGEEITPERRYEAAQAGVIDIVRIPCSDEALKRAIGRTLELERTRAHENVIAFLPAKAGSGSTTTALNVAASMVHEWNKKVLILESDLHSGLLPVLLKLDPKQSIVDALELSDSLDDKIWEGLVTKAQGLDLLPTPWGKASSHFTPWEYHRLLAFASPRYDFVIVDLPEVVNDCTEAIVTRASRVHIVCTSENSSVFLARRRIHELEARTVKHDRVRVLLNRHQPGESLDEIELLIGRKLAGALPNDYGQVRAATAAGRVVDPACELGRAYRRFAAELAGIDLLPEADERRASGTDSSNSSTDENPSVISTMLDKLRKTLDKVRGEDTVKPRVH